MHLPKQNKNGELSRKGDRPQATGTDHSTGENHAPPRATNSSTLGTGHYRGLTFDVDVERFKSKMESALNAFKVEALSELLVAKRNMLQEHSTVLAGESERHQCEMSVKDAEVSS